MDEPISCNEWSEQFALGVHNLSPTDRHTFEAHIRVCSMCSLIFTEYGEMTSKLCHLPVPDLPDGLPPLLLQQWQKEEKLKIDTGIDNLVKVIEEDILPKHNDVDGVFQSEASALPLQSVRAFLEEKQLDEEEVRKQKELKMRKMQKDIKERENQERANSDYYNDKTLICRECGNHFVFTAGEQEFYQQKGLMNQPGRCPSCRSARRATSGGAGNRSERAPREIHSAICAECGSVVQIPFLPKNGRPVYCVGCFNKIHTHKLGQHI